MGKFLDFSDQFLWSWKGEQEQLYHSEPSSQSVKWYLHLIGKHMWSEGIEWLAQGHRLDLGGLMSSFCHTTAVFWATMLQWLEMGSKVWIPCSCSSRARMSLLISVLCCLPWGLATKGKTRSFYYFWYWMKQVLHQCGNMIISKEGKPQKERLGHMIPLRKVI